VTRGRWIAVLVGGGVVLAIVIGVLGTRNEPSKAETTSTLCSSLNSLESSVKSLTSLDSSTASKSDYQSDVTALQNDWDQVKSDAQAVQNAPTGDLDSAWDNFESAVKDVPDDASVSDALNDVSESAQQLASTAQTTASSVNCSS
jgi:hypothetical protein